MKFKYKKCHMANRIYELYCLTLKTRWRQKCLFYVQQSAETWKPSNETGFRNETVCLQRQTAVRENLSPVVSVMLTLWSC